MFVGLAHKRSAALLKITRSMSRSRCNMDQEPRCKLKTPTSNKAQPETCVPPIWEPNCCEERCINAPSRLDQMFYKYSDKATRSYPQTWVECPSPIKKTKISCCFDDDPLPPFERRPAGVRPKTACNMQKQEDYTRGKKPKCTRVSLPGCRSRRNTYHCLVDKNPSAGCPIRECAPYPSFSECIRSRTGTPKRECGCVFDPQQCEVYKEMERWLWSKMK